MFDNNDDDVACVASVSNRVIARKLERKQKKILDEPNEETLATQANDDDDNNNDFDYDFK